MPSSHRLHVLRIHRPRRNADEVDGHGDDTISRIHSQRASEFAVETKPTSAARSSWRIAGSAAAGWRRGDRVGVALVRCRREGRRCAYRAADDPPLANSLPVPAPQVPSSVLRLLISVSSRPLSWADGIPARAGWRDVGPLRPASQRPLAKAGPFSSRWPTRLSEARTPREHILGPVRRASASRPPRVIRQ